MATTKEQLREMFQFDENEDDELIDSIGGKATFNFTLPKEILNNYKSFEWQQEQKMKRIMEDNEMAGYSVEHEQHPESKVKMHSIFDIPTQYKQIVGDANDLNLRGTLRRAKNASYKGEARSILSTRTMRGFQESIDLINKSPKLNEYHDEMKFARWLSGYGYNLKNLSDEDYNDLYRNYKTETRIRLDILMNKIMEMVDGYFIHLFLETTGANFNQEQIESFLSDDDGRLEIIKAHRDDTGKPLIPIENYTIMRWYFEKYGFQEDDKKFFLPDTLSYLSYAGSGETMSVILDRFYDYTGFDFYDVYKYHYKQYVAGGGTMVANKDVSDNDTVEVTDDVDIEVIDLS